MVDKNINKNHDHNLNKNSFSKKNIDDFDKAKLQEFYSSILGNNMEEVKKNSQRLRLKIYVFGLFIIVLTLILTFFMEKISFVQVRVYLLLNLFFS